MALSNIPALWSVLLRYVYILSRGPWYRVCRAFVETVVEHYATFTPSRQRWSPQEIIQTFFFLGSIRWKCFTDVFCPKFGAKIHQKFSAFEYLGVHDRCSLGRNWEKSVPLWYFLCRRRYNMFFLFYSFHAKIKVAISVDEACTLIRIYVEFIIRKNTKIKIYQSCLSAFLLLQAKVGGPSFEVNEPPRTPILMS